MDFPILGQFRHLLFYDIVYKYRIPGNQYFL